MFYFGWFNLLALLAVSGGRGVSSSTTHPSILALNSIDGEAAWLLWNKNHSVTVFAKVPGGVYSDLARAGVIGDILAGYNDVATRWVAYDTWTYNTKFNVTANQMALSKAKLVFEGLDTMAYVELNDHPVVRTDNMFVRYSIDVHQYLKVGVNILRVTFDSPVAAARARSEKHFVAPRCVAPVYHGECHANQIRKMQASFAWDWGPALPSVGIWKPVYLQFYNTTVLTSVTTHLIKKSTSWEVNLVVYLESVASSVIEGYLEASLEVDSKAIKTKGSEVSLRTDAEGITQTELVMNISENEVSLWWPSGYGDQQLYNLTVLFTNRDNLIENSDIHSQINIQIGFRTLELIEEDAVSKLGNNTAGQGKTFYFKVNGYPLFMKGSNWIPAHILPELSTNESIADELLVYAKDAHMTMLRVWGGGVYESDYFYQRCDQLGILVWQDFMFACSMYPVDADFLRSVKMEVQQNVIRLQHHASIAVWAGNNENEAALRGNWYQTQSEFDTYKEQYVKLYVDTIKPIVESIDPGRRYLVSSPSNGVESEEEGYIAANPYNPNYGDTHYYNYLANGWSMNIYPKTRFASEYGFQSFPSLATLKTATNDSKDLDFGSEFVSHRQHSPGGTMAIKTSIDFNLRLHESDAEYFEKFVFASQISQAMAIKAETEFYRQSQADWYTMGALYWQLNDVWQAPSWSSIEFGGKWKMLHYFARNFFAPILVSPRLLLSGDIEVYLINEKFVPLVDAKIIIETYQWNSQSAKRTKSYNTNIDALTTNKQDILISALDINRAEEFFRFSLKSSDGTMLSPYNYIFPEALKNISGLKIPKLEISVRKSVKKNRFTVQVSSNTIVLFLWLEAEGIDGYFSENGLIITDVVTSIEYVSRNDIEAEKLQASIMFQYYTT